MNWNESLLKTWKSDFWFNQKTSVSSPLKMSETSCFYNMGSIHTFTSFSPDQWKNMLLHFNSYTGRQLVNWTVVSDCHCGSFGPTWGEEIKLYWWTEVYTEIQWFWRVYLCSLVSQIAHKYNWFYVGLHNISLKHQLGNDNSHMYGKLTEPFSNIMQL